MASFWKKVEEKIQKIDVKIKEYESCEEELHANWTKVDFKDVLSPEYRKAAEERLIIYNTMDELKKVIRRLVRSLAKDLDLTININKEGNDSLVQWETAYSLIKSRFTTVQRVMHTFSCYEERFVSKTH